MLLLCMLTTMTAWAELRATLTTETTELTTGTYNSSAITIDHRLTVNGDVTLFLVSNVAMTINGGIKLTPGSTLTIEGAISNFNSTPNLTIRECPDDEAGIRVHPGCTLIINGGFLDIEGGPGAAAIGGNNDAEAGSQNTNVRAFVLNFGDEASGITTTECIDNTNSSNAWYTLDGRKLSGNPSQRGVYVNGGRKVVIK